MRHSFLYSFLLVLVFACREQGKASNKGGNLVQSNTKKVWRISSATEVAQNMGLLNVESIVYDKSNQVLYASNGKDYKPGVDGFISKISMDGTVEDLKWVSNLNRPAGMALKDSILYVADVNALIAINTKNGKIISKYNEPIKNSGLNDVTVNSNGEVYVSASFVHAVFKLENNVLEPWVVDSEKLQWANGLAASNKKVVVGGLGLNAISTDSGQIQYLNIRPEVKDFDGIEADDLGGYFLTTVENSGLFHLDSNGTITKLMDGEAYFGDLEFIPSQNKLYIPRGNHETNDYFITILTLTKK